MLREFSPPILGVRGVLWNVHVVACFRLASRLIFKKKNKKKKMPKGCLMVMADPLDLGHGKKVNIQISYFSATIIKPSCQIKMEECKFH